MDRNRKPGFCQVSWRPKVAGYEAHFGEEACLVGEGGSGAIFFSGCNLACVFCQTYEISRLGAGEEVSPERLAEIMLELKNSGCHNINLVSPTHQIRQILEALEIAISRGLDLPIVYNTGSYEALETLKALEGIVDIYLADFKVWDEEVAAKILEARDYPEVAQAALKEMYRQVGNLVCDEKGLARKGLILRHLVLPGGIAGTKEIFEFVKKELSQEIYINLMGHYHPEGEAFKYPPLDRPLTREEFEEALRLVKAFGFTRLDKTHWPLLALLWGEEIRE